MAKDWTQEKLIDTLEKECEQLRGWYIAKIDQNAELQTQIESCSAEIERLREALGKIADYETEEDCPCAACEHAVIARSALQQKESE